MIKFAIVFLLAISQWFLLNPVDAKCGCEIREDQHVQSVTEARNAITYLRKHICCGNLHVEAFDELSALLGPHPIDVCSEEVISKFENFHTKYVHLDGARRTWLPESLRNFFVELSLKMNYHCKRVMVANLKNDEANFDSEDNDRFEYSLRQDGTLNFFLKDPSSYDELTFIMDLFDPNSNIVKEKKRGFSGSSHDYYVGMHSSCTKTFRPIYARRILPVIKLAHLGYSYEPKNGGDLAPIKEMKDIQRWYKMAFLCEAMLTHEYTRHGRPEQIEPKKRQLEVSNIGELEINDLLWQSDNIDTSSLQKAVEKFNPKRDYLKNARKSFIKQINNQVKRVVLKRLKIKDLIGKNRKKVQINVSRLIDEIQSEKRKPPTTWRGLINLDNLVLTLLILLPPGWIMLIVSYLFHRQEYIDYKERQESTRFIIEL